VPELVPLRVYLDSNVLFSASLSESSRFLDFWRLRDVTPVVSHYVIGEVARNIRFPDHNARLASLLRRTEIVSDADNRMIPADVRLVSKDQPILAAAIAASVDYLATGDKNHFSHLYSRRITGVVVMNPADFLDLYEDRLPE
jgi:predicted nucleic acid-binding protein